MFTCLSIIIDSCYQIIAISHLLSVTCYLLLAICYLLSYTCYYLHKLVSFCSLLYISYFFCLVTTLTKEELLNMVGRCRVKLRRIIVPLTTLPWKPCLESARLVMQDLWCFQVVAPGLVDANLYSQLLTMITIGQ